MSIIATSIAGSVLGMAGGAVQDWLKARNDRLEQKQQNDLEIQKLKALEELKFEFDKKRAESDIALSNIELEQIQAQQEIQKSNVNIAEQTTEQEYFNNITKATLEPLHYEVPFLKMEAYTNNTVANVAIGITNFLYGIVNVFLGLCSSVKYLRELNGIARPILSFYLILIWQVLALKLDNANLLLALEALSFLTDAVFSFWFYRRSSEKIRFQKKN